MDGLQTQVWGACPQPLVDLTEALELLAYWTGSDD
jgi:hypothetical protein